MPDVFAVTVSQINRRLSMMIKDDKALANLYVRGEISNFTYHSASGHMYFTLKDDSAAIKCVMFKSYADKLKYPLQSGMRVLLHAAVGLYERDGCCQLYVSEVFPEGAGEMYLAFEQVKSELERGGYFAQKRDLPLLPRTICIITAEKGAALQDMLNIIGRRCPIIKIILIPVTVQGITAPQSLTNAVIKAQDTDADIIIIGRGGGSAEDLSAFNDTGLAKALFASRIPTISAVGHQTDFTIADFVADKRAPTPSAAAELATAFTCDDMIAAAESKLDYLRRLINGKLDKLSEYIDSTEKHISALSPAKKLEGYERESELLFQTIQRAVINRIDSCDTALRSKAEYISALNPMTVLSRGYSIVRSGGRTVPTVNMVNVGDELDITLSDGVIKAEVKNVQSHDSDEKGK